MGVSAINILILLSLDRARGLDLTYRFNQIDIRVMSKPPKEGFWCLRSMNEKGHRVKESKGYFRMLTNMNMKQYFRY